jgi:hypothetical protein
MLPPESNDRGLHEVPDCRASRGDCQEASLPLLQGLNAPQAELDRIQALERGIFEQPAGRRGRDPAGMTFEQLHTQLRLQAGDVLADGRLGAPKLPGQRAQIAGLAGRHQDFEVFQGHRHI